MSQNVFQVPLLAVVYFVAFRLCGKLIFFILGPYHIHRDAWGIDWNGVLYMALAAASGAAISVFVTQFYMKAIGDLEVLYAACLAVIFQALYGHLFVGAPLYIYLELPAHSLLTNAALVLSLPLVFISWNRLRTQKSSANRAA